MKIRMLVEMAKDKSGKVKRTLWTTVETDIIGMEKISTVAEMPDKSTLAKEIDWMVTEMVELKKKSLKEKNKKLIAKRKKK